MYLFKKPVRIKNKYMKTNCLYHSSFSPAPAFARKILHGLQEMAKTMMHTWKDSTAAGETSTLAAEKWTL